MSLMGHTCVYLNLSSKVYIYWKVFVNIVLLVLQKYFFSSQSTEMNVWHKRVSELTSRLAEVEENLAKTQKELLKSQDTNSRLQRDLTENIAQKEDQVRLLEKQY